MNRVLHIISSLNVGGAEMMLYRLLRQGQSRLNEQHIVISLSPEGDLKKKYQEEGIEVFMLDVVHKPFFTCKKIISIIRKNNPNVIQTWMYHADLVGGVLARSIGFKNVYWGIRNTYVPNGSKFTYILMKVLALMSYFIPKKIICVADSAKAVHINEGYCAKKMLTINNGYDFSSLTFDESRACGVRKEFGIGDKTLIIGCLGRYHHDKGQDLFINTVAKFTHKNFKFMLVGRDCDWSNEELVRLIDKFNLKKSFILTGERTDVTACLSTFNIFCMPSRTEGFPNALAEAMGAGLPCVGFNVGDARKLSGEGVELVDANNIESLFTKLESISNCTDEQRKRLGRKAEARVKENFSIKKIYDEYKAAYELIG